MRLVLHYTHALNACIVRLTTILNLSLGWVNTVCIMKYGGFPHFRFYSNTLTYESVLVTKLSVHITIDGCISGVSAQQGSTVFLFAWMGVVDDGSASVEKPGDLERSWYCLNVW